MTKTIEVSDKNNGNKQQSVKKAIQSRVSDARLKVLATLTVSIAALVSALLALQGGSVNEVQQSAPSDSEQLMSRLPPGSKFAFNYLSNQRSNLCGLRPEAVLGYADEMRLQGSCCSPMDLHRYQEQVEGLRQYADISQIPVDPYDMPVPLVQELLAYQTNIQLTAEQQLTYDEAMSLLGEGGPCCWRWYAFEGLGKYLNILLEYCDGF